MGRVNVARWSTTPATADGRPFLFDEAYLPPDRVQVVVSRQGTRCVTDLVPVFATPP